jgi:hypothetical protein
MSTTTKPAARASGKAKLQASATANPRANPRAKAKPKPKPKASATANPRAKPKAKAKPNPKPNINATAKPTRTRKKPVLLTGGNPQIAKGEGNAPVQAYIAALPGWKRPLAKRLDAIIERAVPQVRKAVKWNSPFYGIEGQGWFLGVHTYTKYLKLAFFRGSSLDPLPPGESKHADVRYLDIREDDEIDEPQLTRWLQQAASVPGWDPGRRPE